MKKLLILFALCALASASFAAVTVSDWKVSKPGIGSSVADGSISDVSPAGFDFDAGLTDVDCYIAVFRSENISGWVYDENNTFSVVVTGFDDMPASPDSLALALFCGDSYIIYDADYYGAGTYNFGPDNMSRKDVDMIAGDSFDFVSVTMTLSSMYCTTTGTTTGSMRLVFGEEEKPDTVVPEPATCAYALMGFGSLLGIKKHIKK